MIIHSRFQIDGPLLVEMIFRQLAAPLSLTINSTSILANRRIYLQVLNHRVMSDIRGAFGDTFDNQQLTAISSTYKCETDSFEIKVKESFIISRFHVVIMSFPTYNSIKEISFTSNSLTFTPRLHRYFSLISQETAVQQKINN